MWAHGARRPGAGTRCPPRYFERLLADFGTASPEAVCASFASPPPQVDQMPRRWRLSCRGRREPGHARRDGAKKRHRRAMLDPQPAQQTVGPTDWREKWLYFGGCTGFAC
jgi:hypothetical protein